MSRCACCDLILPETVLSMKRKDGLPEDLCSCCRQVVALDVLDIMEVRDYAHHYITSYPSHDGVTRIKQQD